MGSIALDSSVVIALFRRDDAHHEAVRTEIAAARTREDVYVLPASVLSEAMVGAYRNATATELRRRIVGLFGPVRALDEQVALAAAELRGEHRSLRLPDAVVVATGIVDDAVVLTCDRRLAGVDPRVQVIG
ncbi:type II toxin-antitoxin system VapC family toxin [Pseudonocardia abyssalis]|uniref:Ribonuclease VapC n=1 Tax=Pseudonocardia abyssalis TaxID=2792008 RepID=A0ABS6UWB3_9PSEU|nr:PIN domain-containing protein [Pseudonocardia abyssalis]MBW0118087.1 PIN domain-containing protein [Pseudonocardia abyssalis]MBW0136564.1 PIN domain-containing protein [Pseudonocardia abyssalis]